VPPRLAMPPRHHDDVQAAAGGTTFRIWWGVHIGGWRPIHGGPCFGGALATKQQAKGYEHTKESRHHEDRPSRQTGEDLYNLSGFGRCAAV
jgi:hypothetical protein